MDTHILFTEFSKVISLNNSKIRKLKKNRQALRDKIKTYFKIKGWKVPKFYSQGSFPLNTNLNPIKKTTDDGDIKEEYDLDDGIYFLCSEEERKEVHTYHNRIMKAVDGHTESSIDKNTCVRVVYADGHHIDLPSYWLEAEGVTPKLAHKAKGFIYSDPKEFKYWVDSKVSSANSNGQLRRLIRYFKAWKDYRHSKNGSLKLPSGFILTILICNAYVKSDRDDTSFQRTIEIIKESLDSSFACYRPTTPKYEELLKEFSKGTVLKEFDDLINNLEEARLAETLESASYYLRQSFGERFPKVKQNEHKPFEPTQNIHLGTKVSKPWKYC